MQRVHGSPLRRCALPDTTSTRPAVFLDRDGTICEEVGYLSDTSCFRIFPFAAAAIRRLNQAQVPVIVVTNQSGVGRGYFPESLVQTVHDLMEVELAGAGARLDGIYFCPHTDEDECDCRKPKLGMLERAAREHSLDLRRSFVVGDRYGDVELAHRAGARGILVRSGYGATELASQAASWPAPPDLVTDTVEGAVDWILRQSE
jgi:D-glycero-D-manno-heptose 1,7-bisphosphate phosphatase